MQIFDHMGNVKSSAKSWWCFSSSSSHRMVTGIDIINVDASLGGAENILALHKKITDAFQLFDYDSNKTVNVREIGTIMYSLGCFPSQADIRVFTAKVGEDFSGVVHLDKFLPAMTKVLLENRFPPIPRSKLFQAFKVLDKDQKGYLKPEELTKYMMENAEPFTQEEMDEMLAAHTHQKENVIHYEKLIDKLTAV